LLPGALKLSPALTISIQNSGVIFLVNKDVSAVSFTVVNTCALPYAANASTFQDSLSASCAKNSQQVPHLDGLKSHTQPAQSDGVLLACTFACAENES
jgi:hypothetical protein